MSDFTLEELFELYKRVFLETREEGFDDDQAGKVAWQEVCTYAPELNVPENYKKDSFRTKLLSYIGGFRYSINVQESSCNSKQNHKDHINKLDDLDRFDNENTFFKDRMESAALLTGRIVDPKYLITFIGPFKAKQVTSYISHLRNDGYEFGRDEYGYFVISYPPEPEPEPEPEPKSISPMFNVSRELIEGIVTEVVNRLSTKH